MEPFWEVCWDTLKKIKKRNVKKKKKLSSQNHDFFKSQTKIIEFKQSDKHQFVIDKLLKFKSFKKGLCLTEKFENIHTQKEKISKKRRRKKSDIGK